MTLGTYPASLTWMVTKARVLVKVLLPNSYLKLTRQMRNEIPQSTKNAMLDLFLLPIICVNGVTFMELIPITCGY